MKKNWKHSPFQQYQQANIKNIVAAKRDASILPGEIESAFRIKSGTSANRPPLIMVKFTKSASHDNLFDSKYILSKYWLDLSAHCP